MTLAVLAADPTLRAISARRVRENVRRLLTQEGRDSATVLRVLHDARARIVSELTQGTEFDQQRAREMLQVIDREVARLRFDLRHPLTSSFRNAAQIGDETTLADARALLGTDAPLSFGIDRVLIDFAAQNSADLVDQIAGDLRTRLNQAVRSAATGASTPADVARSIGTVLREANRDPGVFGRLSTQVERVHRTEVGRIYRGATEVREAKVARESPFVMSSRWIATPGARTRPSHWRMNGAIVPVGEHFNFGAGAPWHLGSYEAAQREGGALGIKVAGPLDAALPAGEAVNCRCDTGLVKGPRKEDQ